MDDFTEFATLRTPHLYRTAWLLCGDQHGAWDLVQETLAKVYVAWNRRRGVAIDNPAGYAHTTLVRTFIDSRRKRSSSELPVGQLPEGLQRPEDVALRLTLIAALDQLNKLDRTVLVLRFLEDLSIDQVAQLLNVSPGAVRSRTLRALEKIRTILNNQLGELAGHP